MNTTKYYGNWKPLQYMWTSARNIVDKRHSHTSWTPNCWQFSFNTIIFAHFDIRSSNYKTQQSIQNLQIQDDWSLKGDSISALQIMDSPLQEGHCFTVLPTMLASLNFHAVVRTRQFNFTTNEFEDVEVNLLQNADDLLIINLLFTLQQ